MYAETKHIYRRLGFDDFTKEIFVFLHSDWSKVHFRLDTSSTEIYLAHVSIFSIVRSRFLTQFLS